MNATAPSSLPRNGSVFLEQVRVVGRGLRREALGLGCLLLLATAIVFIVMLREGERVDFEPVGAQFTLLAGLLLPLSVWRGEKPFGGGYLWTLPVERRRHALLKLAAGGLWLLLAVTAFLLWLLVLALLTGGGIGADETRMLATGSGAHAPVRWTTPAWEWAAPFTAALIGYLLGSALALGVEHPVRTAAALLFGFLLLLFLFEEVFPVNYLEPAVQQVMVGTWGLDAALTGGAESLSRDVKSANGEQAFVSWSQLPSAERWASASALWTALGAAALFAALRRHREH